MKETVVVAILVCMTVLWFATRTNTEASAKTLREAGYTNVDWAGYQWFVCGDWSATGFHATGPTGQPADGVVCCGLLLKGCTIRH